MSATKRDAESPPENAAKRAKLATESPGSAKKKKEKQTFAQEIALNKQLSAPGNDATQNGNSLNCAVCREVGTKLSAYPAKSQKRGVADERYELKGPDNSQVAVVQCHLCYVSVHTVCYGVQNVKGRSDAWRCDRCLDNPAPSVCELCPNLGGAFMSAGGKKWVHVACAVWIPETRFSDWPNSEFQSSAPGMQPPVLGTDDISKARHKLKCKVCKLRAEQGAQVPRRPKGACIQCGNGQCPTAAHVTCALESLPTHIDWSLFPSHKSLQMYCQDRHIPTWVKEENRLKLEKKLAPLAVAEAVRANPGDNVWVRGVVQTAEARPFCWVKINEEEYRLGVDEVVLHPDEEGPIAPGKRVVLKWEEGGQDDGTVGTMEEVVIYSVRLDSGEVVDGLTRSSVCTEREWLTYRPPGAVGDDEQSEAETNGEEGEDAREDVNMADIDQRFIVEKTQRQAAAKAAEETSKLLHDDVNPAPGATATTAPVAKATTPAKNKQPADKKAAPAKEMEGKPKPAKPAPKMTSCWDILESVKGIFDAWVGQRLEAKAEKAKVRAALVQPK